jgi:hypothetical protein
VTTFLWVVIGITILEAIGKLSWLVTHRIPGRKPISIAFDIIGCVVLAAWAMHLL